MKKLPIFPLNAHLFTGGRLKLNIFEQRYLNMVKDCFKQQSPFILGMLNQQGIEPIGTLSHIVDFEMSDKGLLVITIEGGVMVDVGNYHKDDNNLGWVTYEPRAQWGNDTTLFEEEPHFDKQLFNIYQQILEDVPLLADRGVQTAHNDRWLALRFLEILPLSSVLKVKLLRESALSEVLDTIHSFIHKSDPSATSDVKLAKFNRET